METAELARAPTSDIDFWSDDVLLNPYPYYEELRALGPAVWLSNDKVWVVTRHKEVREALLNGEVFSSAHGCMLEESINNTFAGIMLCSDDPVHRRMRSVFARPLMPAAVGQLKDRLTLLAEPRVDELIARGSFDAVTDLAHYLPLTVVTDLVGLSERGKGRMLEWAAGIFNVFGPARVPRTMEGMELVNEAFQYLQGVSREELDPEGWGAALFAASDRGEIPAEAAKAMLMDYLGPSLDTTINGLSSALWLFGHNPDQWTLLRENPHLIPQAIDEVLRLESPIRGFTRYVTRDHHLGDVLLPAGARAFMLYGCANRDDRRYEDPDRFDITRNPRDHVAFGYGTHICAGMHLAKLEIATVLDILLKRVARFEILDEVRTLHNNLRGLAQLTVRVEPA